MFIALTMVDASVYQMMRGIIVVITALLAWIFLGKKQHRHHWTGVVFILGGVAWVGYVAIALEGKECQQNCRIKDYRPGYMAASA